MPLLLRVALLEFFNTSTRLNVALASCEERMTLRADIDAQFSLGRTRRKRVATAACHRRLEELRMNTLFHVVPPRFFCRIQACSCTLG